ncbi:MAG: hypothetical protein F7C38_06265 [Desulfurococcales archaeon]|nr:hypothetical protein [Desulfurococcales archaeon]
MIAGIINIIKRGIESVARDRVSVEEFGPTMTTRLRYTTRYLLVASMAISAASPISFVVSYPFNLILPLVPILLIIFIYTMPRLWKLALATGIDREIPSLLAYALPYSAGPKYLADVLANAPPRYFPWFRWEAERLRFFNNSGLDPISSLKRLSETTPSRSLRDIITDYIHSHELGSPRSQATLKLLEKAVSETRSQWRSYVELGRGIIEALVAFVIAIVAIAPLSILSSGVTPGVVLIPAILSPLATIILTLMRPGIGDLELGLQYITLALTTALASGLSYYLAGAIPALVILLAGLTLLELVYTRYKEVERTAINVLREVAVSARYGRFIEEDLAKAKPVATRAIGALLSALAYAGKLGIGEAVSNILRIIEEAREAVASVRGQGLVMAAIATVVSAVAVYIVKAIGGLASGAQQFGVDASLVEVLEKSIVALSPLTPIPATILWRGRIPSLIPSAISFILCIIVSRM